MAHTAREEAERLVATVFAVAERAGVLRDPDPRLAERLASGAGELASGVAGVLRAVSSLATGAGHPDRSRPRPQPEPPAREPEARATPAAQPDAPGRPPTAAQPPAPGQPDAAREPWSVVTRESNRAAEEAAQAARAARRAARLAEEAARRAQERAEEAAWHARQQAQRSAGGGGGRPIDVWAAATEPPGPRTPDVVEVDRSATVDGGAGESGLAGTGAVDHDGAGSVPDGTDDARDGAADEAADPGGRPEQQPTSKPADD